VCCFYTAISDVVVRTGVPHLQADLKKVSAVGARSVVILADRSVEPDMNDVNAVRTVLSLKGMGAPANGHIVCEVCDVDNENLVKIVGENAVETFVSHDVIGRLMIQCARERGLAQVLESLLGFEGCEFYIEEWEELEGLTFGELMYRFKDAVVIGIMRARENPSDLPNILLNPSLSTVLNKGDGVIVIAEDNDSYSPSKEKFTVNQKRIQKIAKKYNKPVLQPEKMLFIGWRRDVDDMVLELDSYVAPGSELMMFSQLDISKREVIIIYIII
jgi:K+/H+ antiporter YhaU regulatory subunit KhtT